MCNHYRRRLQAALTCVIQEVRTITCGDGCCHVNLRAGVLDVHHAKALIIDQHNAGVANCQVSGAVSDVEGILAERNLQLHFAHFICGRRVDQGHLRLALLIADNGSSTAGGSGFDMEFTDAAQDSKVEGEEEDSKVDIMAEVELAEEGGSDASPPEGETDEEMARRLEAEAMDEIEEQHVFAVMRFTEEDLARLQEEDPDLGTWDNKGVARPQRVASGNRQHV